MKLLGKILLIVSLIVAIVMPTYVLVVRILQAPGEGALDAPAVQHDVVRMFDFSSDSDLSFWEEKALAPGETKYELVEHDGSRAVKATSEDSASALYFKKERISFEGKPYVAWDWNAELFPGRTKEEDLLDKDEFDFVAQVYVIFYAKFFLNAEAIQYVWTESVPVGTVSDSPYTSKVKLLVLQSGPSETWKHEMRDIAQDYKDLFGKELNKDIMAISFMTDADSTDTTSIAYFDNIQIGFLEREKKKNPVREKKRGRRVSDKKSEEEVVERGTEVSVKKKEEEI